MKKKHILVGQPKPSSKKSPFGELEENFEAIFHFQQFIEIEPIEPFDYLHQKINLRNFRAIIFQNKNAITHYFKVCKELKIPISPENYYFCFNEQISLYIKKFFDVKKRKIFYGTDCSMEQLFEHLENNQSLGPYLYPCSSYQDTELITWLSKKKIDYQKSVMYNIKNVDLTTKLSRKHFHAICFLTPASVRGFMESYPDFNNNGKETTIFSFGRKTTRELNNNGIEIDCQIPNPETASLSGALKNFLMKSP